MDYSPNHRSIQFFAERRDYGSAIAIYARHIGGLDNSAVFTVQPVEFKRVEGSELGAHPEPTMEISQTSAQELMDQLWHCGLRPTEGTGSAGSLAATERHLEDMRALVFKSGKP